VSMCIVRRFRSMIICGLCLAYGAEAMSVDRQYLIENPLLLSSQNKIYISDHELTLTRWSLAQPIDDVIQNFSRKVPADTLAWSDGLVMHMLWTSSEHSHVLALKPESDTRVMVILSSMRLKPFASNGSIKSLFLNPRLAATLMLDVKDLSEDVASSTMIYSSEQSISFLYKALKEVLSREHWSVNEDSEQILLLPQSRKIQARLHRTVMSLDLIDHLGKRFIYVNTSEGDRH
jgi:hypothetical protein